MSENETLVDQKLALSLFLESLLREPRSDDVPDTETEPPVEASVSLVPPVAPSEPAPMPAAPADIQTETPAEPVEAPTAPAGTVPGKTPDRDGQPFQALLFSVAGLRLAVPLVELSGIQEWADEEVTPMPGHADFYLGLVQYRGHSVPVVDPAALVMPADRQAELAGDPRERVTRIVFIDEGRWGLACDAVDESITLRSEQVRWRGERTRRRWLAGTVIDQMCALIDTRAFAAMLAEGRE